MTSKARKVFYTILALLVSVSAWLFVVYNYDPLTETRYTDVPVKFTGEAELADRGLVVNDSSSDSMSVVLSQKRVDTNKFASSDIEVVADVSGCVAGDNLVNLNVTGPKDTVVVKTDTDSVNISVVRASRETRDIIVAYGEGAPDDAEPIAFDLSQNDADIICAENQLAKVANVAAVLKYNDVGDEAKSYTCRLYAVDKEGNLMRHVVVYPNEVSLDAVAGFTKTVSLTVPIKNKTNDSYERTYTAPEEVTIKGPQEEIDKIGTVRAEELDLSYVYESGEIPIEYDLPEGVYIANESIDQNVKVKVAKKTQSASDQDE